MKILFLDIDGVLATPRSYKNRKSMKVDGEWFRYESFDQKAVENLNYVLKSTGAKIIISSTWRKYHSLAELVAIFRRERVDGVILGMTPVRITGNPRGIEISECLQDFPPDTRYAIVDDDVFDIKDYHPEKLVHVLGGWSGGCGMLKEHADKLIEILNK